MLSHNIDSMKDDLVAALQESLRIPSVGGEPEEGAPFGAGPRRSLDWTLDFARKMGFRTKNVDDVAGWAELGEGDEMVAILGHLDVVPEGKGWSVDPWGGELKDGMLYGRGVLDNKGPVMVGLFAAKAVFDSKIPLKRRVRVIFGTNEERGSKCMTRYVEAGEELPAAGFTPDAEYPIINAEKGILTYTLSLPFTPSGDFKVLSLEGGVADNVVMAEVKAEVTVPQGTGCRERILEAAASWKGPEGATLEVVESPDGKSMTFVAKGRPAHGSTPELGVNALACLADFMVALRLKEEQGDFFKTFSRLIGFETDGASIGVKMNDEVSGPLTLCSGMVGLDKDRVRFSINIRYPVTREAGEVTAPLLKAFAENGITVEKAEAAAPLYVPKESPLILALQKAYTDVTGEEAGLIAIGGGTYAKTMPNVVAFGPVFPGQKYKIHEEDECWSVEDMMKNAHIMARAIVELAGE